jgi:fatty acid synthase
MHAEPAALPVKAAWLHGNLRDNPGVLGLGHCARLERFGDSLRWILDANHPSAALTNAGGKGAQPALSAQQMLAQAGKLDLVNNVFQNGVHGSLRNTIVEVIRLLWPCKLLMSWTICLVCQES